MINSIFNNKLVLVTGGSSGIGKAIASELLRQGSRVMILSNNPDHLTSARDELQQISTDIITIECDMGDRKSIEHATVDITRHYGYPDILVNNAGYGNYLPFAEESLTDLEQILNVNFLGAMRCCKMFLPR